MILKQRLHIFYYNILFVNKQKIPVVEVVNLFFKHFLAAEYARTLAVILTKFKLITNDKTNART